MCPPIQYSPGSPENSGLKSVKSVQKKTEKTPPVLSKPGIGPKQRTGVLSTDETGLDHQLHATIRPRTLQDYIGQAALKETMQIALDAAKKRGDTLDHLLLYGPPGLGKTTLAMIIADEMGSEIHITSAPALERPRDLLGILMGMSPGSVLFIDEIHRMNKLTEEILYPAMEDFTLDRTVGKGETTKILRIPMPKFTLIGATTKAGSLSGPLRDRFGMIHRLNFYCPETLSAIVLRSANLLEIPISSSGAFVIAERSRGTPRIANRLLRRVRDYVSVKHAQADEIDDNLAKKALAVFDIDPVGLDQTDRQMLHVMAAQFSGGPVGIEALASSMGEDPRTLEDVCEPFLLQAGFVHRTPRGRMLTAKAIAHLNLPSTGD
ncbi:MAG: Holliday junction branch migration DNA helicase RuvB [Cyanobacteria bacterium P01_H01_bin.74]